MFLNLHVGNLIEPLTGRRWDRQAILREYYHRLAQFQRHNLALADRIFIHYGNSLEFFVDLLAIWSLGGCAVPIDPRLTDFEVQNLARVALPRFSLWRGEPDTLIAAGLSAMDIKILETPAAVPDGASIQPLFFSPSLLSMDGPALILFTSGTTGQPKGVVHTHRSLRARWLSLQHCLGTEKFLHTLCLLPTHFGHGLICNCLFRPFSLSTSLFVFFLATGSSRSL